MEPKASNPSPDRIQTQTESDWSRTPAACVAAIVLGVASLCGLLWSWNSAVSIATSPTETSIQSPQGFIAQVVPAPTARLQIDLNTAPAHELELLPSIGPKIAQRVIEDRDLNGPFESLNDLQRVSGIGPKTVEKLNQWAFVSND